VSIVAVVVTVWAVRWAQDLQRNERQAVVDVHIDYVAEGDGVWNLDAMLFNRGPGVARRLQIGYGGDVQVCSSVPSIVIHRSPIPSRPAIENGVKCDDSADLTAAGIKDAEYTPFLFTRAVVDEKKIFAYNAYDAICPELYPGEAVWLEFSSKLAPALDKKLRLLVPFETTETLTGGAEALHETFSDVGVGGVDVTQGKYVYSGNRPEG
jgi:hypothetical protein